jgi:hypothetical protein
MNAIVRPKCARRLLIGLIVFQWLACGRTNAAVIVDTFGPNGTYSLGAAIIGNNTDQTQK